MNKSLTKLSIGHFLLRSVLVWLRHFTPKLHYTKNAHYSGVSSTNKTSIMPTRNRARKKKLVGKGRTNDAARWLKSKERPKYKYVERYAKRYGIDEDTAREELISLGYYEDVFTEELEAEGKETEYIMNPLTGELVLVEAGTEEHELFI
jgi:hypothetical protein